MLLSDSTFSGNIASNVVTLSGDYSVSSVTAVAGTVDTLTLSAGANASVIFSVAGGTEFLFVQGGSSGTSDDSIINLGDLSGGGALAVGGSAAVVTFSGQFDLIQLDLSLQISKPRFGGVFLLSALRQAQPDTVNNLQSVFILSIRFLFDVKTPPRRVFCFYTETNTTRYNRRPNNQLWANRIYLASNSKNGI